MATMAQLRVADHSEHLKGPYQPAGTARLIQLGSSGRLAVTWRSRLASCEPASALVHLHHRMRSVEPAGGQDREGHEAIGPAELRLDIMRESVVPYGGGDYEIRIKGRLSDSLLAAFEGLTATVKPVETVLHGPVQDQSSLHELLDRIQSLGLELVEIRPLPPAADEPDAESERPP